eukprot:4095342-Amphidinium_carterae.1
MPCFIPGIDPPDTPGVGLMHPLQSKCEVAYALSLDLSPTSNWNPELQANSSAGLFGKQRKRHRVGRGPDPALPSQRPRRPRHAHDPRSIKGTYRELPALHSAWGAIYASWLSGIRAARWGLGGRSRLTANRKCGKPVRPSTLARLCPPQLDSRIARSQSPTR